MAIDINPYDDDILNISILLSTHFGQGNFKYFYHGTRIPRDSRSTHTTILQVWVRIITVVE